MLEELAVRQANIQKMNRLKMDLRDIAECQRKINELLSAHLALQLKSEAVSWLKKQFFAKWRAEMNHIDSGSSVHWVPSLNWEGSWLDDAEDYQEGQEAWSKFCTMAGMSNEVSGELDDRRCDIYACLSCELPNGDRERFLVLGKVAVSACQDDVERLMRWRAAIRKVSSLPILTCLFTYHKVVPQDLVKWEILNLYRERKKKFFHMDGPLDERMLALLPKLRSFHSPP